MQRLLRSATVLASVLLFAPLSRAGEKVFDVTGVIRAPLDATNRIVVSHQDIPGLMPAMTMGFSVANPAEVTNLRSGDLVSFRLHVGEAASAASDFVVVGHESFSNQNGAPTPSQPRLAEGDLVPEFSLLSEKGEPVSTADLRDRITLITFMFSRCPLPEYCPAITARFGQIQKAVSADAGLAARVRLLSITLDPEYDRPEILKTYGAAVGANPALWRFATGTKDQISALAKSFAVFAQRNGAVLDHTLCTALIGRDGRVVALWRGNGWRTEDAIAAVRIAAHE